MTKTYELLDGPAIRCLVCNRTSWNFHDVQYLFCGCCKRFHEEPGTAAPTQEKGSTEQ